MKDYVTLLPKHKEIYLGEHHLYIEIFDGENRKSETKKRPPLLFVHGAYTGSWMWSKYLPHFIKEGWECYVMNMRSHYKSRVMDLSQVTFDDYLEDIKEVISICKEAPIVIGFSMGGILCQKLAETVDYAGMILIDSCISKEVNELVPYQDVFENDLGLIIPAPERNEICSVDETKDDIEFQRKYLSMESSKAIIACGCWIQGITGISVNSSKIQCPTLVIKSVNSEEDDKRGRAEAVHFDADYTGFWNTTHTGLLVGQRYYEIVNRVMEWLNKLE